MAIETRGRPLTYEEYLELPDDGKRYELINGEMYVSAAPNTSHQMANTNLTVIVGGYVRMEKLGRVFSAPTDLLLEVGTVIQPDLLFISSARLAIIHEDNVRGAPDLVVEIASPSSRLIDRQTKMTTYARFGVPSYWIFDPATREADAYVLDRGDYRRVASAVGNGPFAAPPFPELIIQLLEVWD